MRFDDLDCRQREVVDAVVKSDDKILVLGRPGTGKTTTALWSARTYLETSDEKPAPRVLFLTFSRTAVSQIMTRSPGVALRLRGPHRGSHLSWAGLSTAQGLRQVCGIRAGRAFNSIRDTK